MLNKMIKQPTPRINLRTNPYKSYKDIKEHIPIDILNKYLYLPFGSVGGSIAARLHKQGHDIAIVKANSRSRGILINKKDKEGIRILKNYKLK